MSTTRNLRMVKTRNPLKQLAHVECKVTPFVFRAVTVIIFITALLLFAVDYASPRDTGELDRPLPRSMPTLDFNRSI